MRIIIQIFALLLLVPPVQADEQACVILLHGLARTAGSMEKLADTLREQAYTVSNIDYPSRTRPVETLAPMAIDRGLDECYAKNATTIHFVTHSMGGILVRQYLKTKKIPKLQRVVMLAPPNQGSEVVDHLKRFPGFTWLNGPAGLQLGTSDKDIPHQLGPVKFELGVIAGTRSINLILSNFLPDPDDGKVSVASTKVDGMKDFIALPVSHPFIMKNNTVIKQVLHFLQNGNFSHNAQPQSQLQQPQKPL